MLPLSQTSNLLYFDEYCNHLFEISQVPGKMCMYSFCRVASTDMLTVFYPQIRASVNRHLCITQVPVYTLSFHWVLTVPTHGGMAQVKLTWVPVSVPRWFTRPKTVIHPGTKQAWHRITTGMLIETNALPLCQIDTNTNTQQL